MSDVNINKMDFKQLRNEVQLLRDELAIFKRKYEDAIYNLSSDNFGKSFTVEQNNMKSQIKVTADSIKTLVSETDLTSKLEEYSTIEQTAKKITSTVTKNYVTNLIGDTYVTNAALTTAINQSADEIVFMASQTYETKEHANNTYITDTTFESAKSEIALKANTISSRVTNLETFKTSVFTQTEYGFTLDGDVTTFTGVIYLTDNSKIKKFDIFHDESQGYEQVFIVNCGNGGLPITIGQSGDTLDFSQCNGITWGSNAPTTTVVFG